MSIDDEIAADDGPYGFINIHYRAAGATLFGSFAKGAYEYDDKVYAAKNEHVSSNDLCIECHSAHEGKLFIASPGFGPTGCSTCHTNIVTDAAVDYDGALDEVRDIRMYGSQADYDGDGDAAEGMYYEIYGATGLAEQLLDEIKTYAADTVGTAVVYDAHAYPYFFIDTNGDGITDPDEVSYGNRYSLFDATLLKAAYNYQVSQKDTGAYAHNPTYIIEVLYDSIEDLGGDVSGLARDDVGHFAAASEPFRHWDEDDAMSTNCGKCHSSEGAAAFFAYGVVTSDDFKPYTRGVSSGLACESCHVAPFDGTLRTQSAVTFPSGVVVDATTDGAADLFAAGNDSPLCMTCHQGRSSTDTLDARIASGNLGFSNIHYYAAAASFFGSEVRGGYQYSGKTYAGTMTYPGSHSFAGLTTCEGCHMDGEPSHDFKPVAADCAGCHEFVTSGPGEDFKDLGDGVSENYDDIQTLKSELESLLKASGVTFLAGYPYFSNITTAAELRAAYNWQVADKEPCGYIHNPDYMMQLLYDSIEDMGGVPSVSRPSPDET